MGEKKIVVLPKLKERIELCANIKCMLFKCHCKTTFGYSVFQSLFFLIYTVHSMLDTIFFLNSTTAFFLLLRTSTQSHPLFAVDNTPFIVYALDRNPQIFDNVFPPSTIILDFFMRTLTSSVHADRIIDQIFYDTCFYL